MRQVFPIYTVLTVLFYILVKVKQIMSIPAKSLVVIQMLQFPSLRRALAVGCSVQMIQQLAGINTVM